MPGPEAPAELSQPAVDRMVADALAAFAAAGSSAELKAARLAHTGEKSPLALANRAIGALPGIERKDAGQRLGLARAAVQEHLAARSEELGAAELAQQLVAERIDVTLPVEITPEGAPHPITALIDLMGDVFIAMGWEIAEGPQAEGEWLNFDALNLGPDHPARGTSDTLFVDPIDHHMVLRTHTSPVQVRTMLDRRPPIYVVCPGKVYRADEFDATHVPVFHQIEGLCIDKGISLAHLKGTLDHLAKAMFGDDIETRMRPHYFPFTEPSAEVDLQCFVCHGVRKAIELRVERLVVGRGAPSHAAGPRALRPTRTHVHQVGEGLRGTAPQLVVEAADLDREVQVRLGEVVARLQLLERAAGADQRAAALDRDGRDGGKRARLDVDDHDPLRFARLAEVEREEGRPRTAGTGAPGTC